MDWSDFFAGDEPSPIRRQLQGPRPTPLRVHKDSHKIKKPPVVPKQSRPPPPAPPPAADRQPVIIYAVSPKIIHTTADDFMNLVQRLTGPSSSYSPSSMPCMSPAARIASVEMTSPTRRNKKEGEKVEMDEDLMGMIEGVEMGQFQGILSPAPGNLPIIPSGYFSPGFEMNNEWMNGYVPSPATLFSAPLVSPSPSSYDVLSQFFLGF